MTRKRAPAGLPIYALLAQGWPGAGLLRTSWFQSLPDAIAAANMNAGVEAIEEIGVGIVWTCQQHATEQTP